METTALSMFNSTIKYHGNDIFIKPFCDFFKIEYDNQCRRIKSSPLLKTSAGKNTSMLLFGDERERVTLTKQGFITWILQLNPSIVQVSLQEKLLQYQTLIFDFMFGSIKREESIRLKYMRLKKLKKLKSKIANEISNCEEEIKSYLDGKFIQTKIQFEKPKELNGR
jgi:hypothetical protein